MRTVSHSPGEGLVDKFSVKDDSDFDEKCSTKIEGRHMLGNWKVQIGRFRLDRLSDPSFIIYLSILLLGADCCCGLSGGHSALQGMTAGPEVAASHFFFFLFSFFSFLFSFYLPGPTNSLTFLS